MKLFLSILFFTSIFNLGFTQVRGTISDAATGGPIEKAIIISESETVFSNSDGNFNISASEYLNIEADGYRGQTIAISGGGMMQIRLYPLVQDLSEVQITAYHTPTKLRNFPGALSRISIEPIRAVETNISQALSSSPGVFVQEATPATMKVSLRGIGSRYPYGTKKIKIFFDEIPLHSAEGETYFDELSPEYLDRIEVLRGPASSIFGASLGGTVLLYPKRPEYGVSELKLSSVAGSFGYYKNSVQFSEGKKNSDYLISLQRVDLDGYRENNTYGRNSFLLNHNHRYSEKLSGALLLSGSLVKAEIPSSIDSVRFVSNPRAAAPNWLRSNGAKNPNRVLAGYKLKFNASEKLDFSASLFGTFRENEENRPFNFLNEEGYSYGTRLLAQYRGLGNNFQYLITGGVNLFYERYKSSISRNIDGLGVKGALLEKGSQFIFQNDIFTQGEIHYNDFILSGGLNFNKSGFNFSDLFSSDTVDQSGSYFFKPVFAPRLSIAWNKYDKFSVYSSVNYGFTIPALSETQTPLGLINRDIKPERAWSYETGLRMDIVKNISSLDLALYYMKVSDLIVPKRVEEDFYVGMNAGSSLHRGMEIGLQQVLFGDYSSKEHSRLSSILTVAYTISRFQFLDFIEDNNDFSGKQIPGMPQQYFRGGIDLKTRSGIYWQTELVASGKIPINDANTLYSSAYQIFNSGLGYSLNLNRNWVLDALLRVNNISNTHYASMLVVNAPGTANSSPRYYYPGMPRSFYVNFQIAYRFGSQ
jgi:iron complex outermembrane recepter protein